MTRPRFNPLETERKIHFYRVDAGYDEGGNPLSYDPTEALTLLRTLDYQDMEDSGPYLDTADGNALCCWVDSLVARHRLRYVRIRRTGLPSLLQGGLLGPLGIPADSGLAEEIHVIFFENNIAGCDFNFFGPRATSLGYYVQQKCHGNNRAVRLEPLLNLDVTGKLNRLRDISVLKLRVRPSFAEVIRSLDEDLSSGLAALQRAGQSEEIELALRPLPYSKNTLKQTVLDAVRRMARLPNLREEASQFEVKGFDTTLRRSTVVDVLDDQLLTSKRMLKQDERSRAVTSESAYAAITESFEELRNDLIEAASIRV